jgi:hypothetical protein
VLNNQQYLSEDFYVQILGSDGMQTSKKLSPDEIGGDFYYPIHDGTLPLDRIALLDVWKEIMNGVASSPELNAKYDLGKIFEFTAELGGARNIEGMKRAPQPMQAPDLQPQEQVDEGVRKGDMVPAGAFDPRQLA